MKQIIGVSGTSYRMLFFSGDRKATRSFAAPVLPDLVSLYPNKHRVG